MKTVKLATILEGGVLSSPYDSGNFSISFSTCSEIKDGAVRMLTGFYHCREAVVGGLLRFFNPAGDAEFNEGDNKKINILYQYKDTPKKRTSVAVHFNIKDKDSTYIKAVDEYMKRSIKLLNHYERRNKWFLSEVYKANHDATENNLIYLFKSSKWWMTSTHTYSLYLLLIRLGNHKLFDVMKKSTPNSEVLSLFSKINEGKSDRGNVGGNYPEKWNILLDNRKKIYEGRTQKDIFNFTDDYFTIKIDGIKVLCQGKSFDKETKDKFAELCKKAGL